MDFIKETLDWVNRERAWRNIGEPLEDLPKGRRKSACDCPIAQALLAEAVSGYSVHFSDDYSLEDRYIKTPECAATFISAFDEGELPQYDEDPA